MQQWGCNNGVVSDVVLCNNGLLGNPLLHYQCCFNSHCCVTNVALPTIVAQTLLQQDNIGSYHCWTLQHWQLPLLDSATLVCTIVALLQHWGTPLLQRQEQYSTATCCLGEMGLYIYIYIQKGYIFITYFLNASGWFHKNNSFFRGLVVKEAKALSVTMQTNSHPYNKLQNHLNI